MKNREGNGVGRRGTRMRAFATGKRALLLLFAVLFITGCASQWSLRTERSEVALQWPFSPEEAKITFLMTMTGFKHNGLATSLVNTVVYGSDGNEEDMFGIPIAVAVGRDGRIAVADTGRKCVHLYIPLSRKYILLSEGEGAKIDSPVGVIFDDELRLYVSDSAAAKVLVFGKEGERLPSIGASSGLTLLKRPTGIAYNSRKKLLYVVDTIQNKVFAFNENGALAFSFGQRGEGAGSFNFPAHIFWSPSGVLYVTDTLNFRIELFDESGVFLSSFGKHGDSPGELAMPKGLAADKDGSVYVADTLFDNIQLFDRNGRFQLTVGRRGNDPGEFWMPAGIFIGQDDILYVCDTYNHRVQLFRITENYAPEK